MRFFKANEQIRSEEDRARDARLTAIASRYRIRDVQHEEVESALPEPRDAIQ